jgi:hypothetical protein
MGRGECDIGDEVLSCLFCFACEGEGGFGGLTGSAQRPNRLREDIFGETEREPGVRAFLLLPECPATGQGRFEELLESHPSG